MKKILMVILGGFLVLGLTVGCGSKQANQTLDNKQNESNEKSIICTSAAEATSEDEMEFKQSYVFHFKNDETTTLDLIQNMKLLKDTEENRKQLTEQTEEDYRSSFEFVYEYMQLDVPEFDVKVNDISEIEREVTITFDYKDFISILNEEELSTYSTFEEISKHTNDLVGDKMTCTYNGKAITNN